jgi:hypothetical protein
MQVSEFSITGQTVHHVKFCSAYYGLSEFRDLLRRALLHTVEQLVAPAQKKGG